MPSNAVQLLIDGTEEKEAQVGTPERAAIDLTDFMKVSQAEGGLLSPAQAAIVLDVSHTRVVDLIDLGKFTRYEFFGKRYVSCREILERRAADLKAGRPPKTIAQRIVSAVKIASQIDTPQIMAEMGTPGLGRKKKK